MLKVAVIYGGVSTEHDVSMISGKNIIDNLDKEKYKVYPAKITKEGIWEDENDRKIKDVIKFLKDMDVVIPALHGLKRRRWYNSRDA